MRPRKVILLVDPCEDRQSITRLVLDNAYYRVLSASSVYEASELGHNSDRRIDLLLGYAPLDEAYLMDVAHCLRCPWALMEPQMDEVLGRKVWPSMADVLDRVKVLCTRKRGPAKGTPRPPRRIEAQIAMQVGA